jgi:aryl-alcohol dehydrogenase
MLNAQTIEGESIPDIFIPQLIELNAQGRFPFEKQTRFYSLDQINQAAQDSEKGGTTHSASGLKQGP